MKCQICGAELDNDQYCETCTVIISALYGKYNIQQTMAMFSHVIGTKITQTLTDTMLNTLKDQYEAENIRKEGKLN